MRLVSTYWLYRRLLFPPVGFTVKRRRLVSSTTLIALVMVPLILALLFMDGMMGGITDKYIMLQDGHIQIHTPKILFTGDEEVQKIDNRILKADYVTEGFGILYSQKNTVEVRIKGVDVSYFNSARLSQFTTEGGILERTGNLMPVMISSSSAKDLGVGLGDRLAVLIVPDMGEAAVRPLFTQVTTIFDSGYYQLDTGLIFMDIKDTIKLFPAASSARTELLVDSRDLDSIDEVLDSLSEKLSNPYRFSTWDAYNRSVYENFITSRQVILMVFLMIILVASVYVSSITGEIIQDDRQSIATLKAMGAGNPLIRRAYFHVSLSITVFGVAIGTGVGLLFGTRLSELMTFLSNSGLPGLQYYLLDFPLTVSWGDIGLVAFSMMVLSSITVLFALKRIGKISPLELLQQS